MSGDLHMTGEGALFEVVRLVCSAEVSWVCGSVLVLLIAAVIMGRMMRESVDVTDVVWSDLFHGSAISSAGAND